MSKDREIEELLQKRAARIVQSRFEEAFTTNTAAEPSTLNAADFIRDMNRLLFNFRRTAVRFVVDLAHPGPMLRIQTPCDGTNIECSWIQANEVHKHWPLRLDKILSRDAAEFVPASGLFGEFVPRILPAPPYEMPEE